MFRFRLLLALLLLLPMQAAGQSTLLQGGSITQGHVPAYVNSGTSQPIVIDSGPAGGGAVGLGVSELLMVMPGSGTPPRSGTGTGAFGTNFCNYDGPNTGPYHFLCLSPNATGGNGLIAYGAAGGATPGTMNFSINGTNYPFPFTVGGIVGPGTTVVGHGACWNNTVGSLLSDCGNAVSVGGTNGQVQFNNAGAFGGFTLGGDATLNTATGALTIAKLNGVTATLGGALSTAGTLTTAGSFTTSGAFPLTLTTTASSSLTLPVAGTLATLAGTEALTNKTYNGNSFTASSGTLTIAAAKTLTVSNTLTFVGVDASTLNIGTGGALGSAAFQPTSAFLAGGTQITATLIADVPMNNTANYFDGPSVAQGGVGTWFASGNVSIAGGSPNSLLTCKLWDGTTIVSSAATVVTNQNGMTVSLSGYLATPAGNLRISCRDSNITDNFIKFNQSGNSKDSTITAFRVQ